MSIDDLAAHDSEWVTPIRVGFRHVEMLEMPPNTQGIYALVALGILNYLPIAELDSTDFYHYQIEAMKLSLTFVKSLSGILILSNLDSSRFLILTLYLPMRRRLAGLLNLFVVSLQMNQKILFICSCRCKRFHGILHTVELFRIWLWSCY